MHRICDWKKLFWSLFPFFFPCKHTEFKSITSSPQVEAQICLSSLKHWSTVVQLTTDVYTYIYIPSCSGVRRCQPACPWDRWIRPGRQRHREMHRNYSIWHDQDRNWHLLKKNIFNSLLPVQVSLWGFNPVKNTQTAFDGGLVVAKRKV